MDDLEIFENTPAYTQDAFIRKTIITKGYFRTLICSRLEEYVKALKEEYGDKTILDTNSTLTKVTSIRTVINNISNNPCTLTPVKSLNSSHKESRGKKRTTKSSKSDDVIFYVSLLSIIGVGVIVAIKLVNHL